MVVIVCRSFAYIAYRRIRIAPQLRACFAVYRSTKYVRGVLITQTLAIRSSVPRRRAQSIAYAGI
jgi:hypothetical protein